VRLRVGARFRLANTHKYPWDPKTRKWISIWRVDAIWEISVGFWCKICVEAWNWGCADLSNSGTHSDRTSYTLETRVRIWHPQQRDVEGPLTKFSSRVSRWLAPLAFIRLGNRNRIPTCSGSDHRNAFPRCSCLTVTCSTQICFLGASKAWLIMDR